MYALTKKWMGLAWEQTWAIATISHFSTNRKEVHNDIDASKYHLYFAITIPSLHHLVSPVNQQPQAQLWALYDQAISMGQP